ncbi:DUF2793 domain-containing protein [Hyphomicrobium sp. CS1GBMeth3]|uniref:DUF2793 domain-containing protein n=1 Tax=Hyphomicrobium sp. CS1GBMeth3 TaxID=1892845 RepID=UPI0009311985|nr:DUF2793 domain-containing protein [Hyphomicrobium sp. CS1GBMeth3]
MDETTNLKLPYILAAQSQKHVTHNEALRALDAVVQLAVADKDLATPPGSPAEGSRYIVAAGPSGSWSGRAGQIAAYQDGAWAFYEPQAGWQAWVADESAFYVFDGAEWAAASALPVPMLGVNASPDETNRVAVASPASLFDHEGAGHQLKINKNAPADTGSVLFQTDYLGRAEFGLAGDDNFHVKVSADGSLWHEAIVIDRATGAVAHPLTPSREVLTANRTYYVRSDGSDSNDGLADSAGGAFLTIAKAISTVAALDLSIYNVTIQLGNGTWSTGPVVSAPWIGQGTVTLRGDPATPANVTIAGAIAAHVQNIASKLSLTGLTIAGTSHGLVAANGGLINVGAGIVFAGSPSTAHLRANGPGSQIEVTSNYTVTSGSARHLMLSPGGYINLFGRTITLSGTLNFSTAFAQCDRCGILNCTSASFTGGTITGKRYDVSMNGVIATGGGGANFFPGSSAGTDSIGGQYV